MLLHGQGIVGAALDRGVVGNDDAFPSGNPTHPGDDARRVHVAAIKTVGGERRCLEEGRAGIDQQIDALARQHLAARGVTGARGLAAAARDLIELVAEIGDQRTHGLRVAREILGFGIDARGADLTFANHVRRFPLCERQIQSSTSFNGLLVVL
jgi:hypothetical protein